MPLAERVLICAISARALAQSARAAGMVPLVLDRFGDDDTAAAAAGRATVAAGKEAPFLADGLLRAAAELAPPPIPLLYGTGFDGAPGLLRRLAEGRELLGNRPASVARVKNPFAFAATCAGLGIPHPETRAEMPGDPEGWLVKRRGGAGGGHVREAGGTVAKGHYVQRRVGGRAVSALLLGDGRRCVVLALSEQWQRPARPRHFSGTLFPAALTPTMAAILTEAAIAVAEAHGLRGLCSADFLLADDGRFHLLEINPRPGASLEAAELHLDTALAALHVAAARGRMPDRLPSPRPGVAATEIVWAYRNLTVAEGFAWPDWSGDRTPAGTVLLAGHPLATVRARAPGPARARALLAERSRALTAALAKARPCA
jgi:predicted ATP-grasp superfamily ATP-dependent carboligase